MEFEIIEDIIDVYLNYALKAVEGHTHCFLRNLVTRTKTFLSKEAKRVPSEISVHDIILLNFSRHSNTCPPFLTRIRRSRKLNYLAMDSSSGVTFWRFTWHV